MRTHMGNGSTIISEPTSHGNKSNREKQRQNRDMRRDLNPYHLNGRGRRGDRPCKTQISLREMKYAKISRYFDIRKLTNRRQL